MHRYPTKILMTTDSIGGVWTYAIELCRFFNNLNIQVGLIVTGELTSASQRAELRNLKHVHLYEKNYKLEWMDDPWDDIDNSGEWLLEIENDFQPDIVHLNSFSYGSLDWKSPVIITAHSDKMSWWKSVKTGPPPPEWTEYYNRVYKGLHSADFIVVPSKFMQHQLNLIYGDFQNMTVIYNGRDKQLFKIGNKKEIIVSAGRIWDEAKDINSLVSVAADLRWKVLIAGSNVSPINNEEASVGSIGFLGRLSQLKTAELFSSASIFVLPAKYEPFGLTPLEAALSGCALVLGKTTSFIEIWDDAALYVTPGDVEELKFILKYLSDNKDIINSYALKAYKRAQLYPAQKMGESYLSLYRNIIRNKRKNHKAVV
jgi:glycosyltransferase involved in cell wall biosynthesis